MDLMISTTLILPLSSTTLKPSATELLDWLRLKEPQIRPKVEALEVDSDEIDEAVKVLAERCKECLLFFLDAIITC